jgi:phospholipid/cholesterol/gamma-HCH transport system ATP-binding protein
MASPLRFENVNIVFDDGVQALNDVSFCVAEGETRIILGAAASGKTVLLKTAMGLVRVTSGKIFLFDEDVTCKPEHDLFSIRTKRAV